MPDKLNRLEWLSDELDSVITYLGQIPYKWPEKGNTAETELYAAGLRDMARWLQEKIEHDMNWQGLLSYFPDLPRDSSNFKLVPNTKAKKTTKPQAG